MESEPCDQCGVDTLLLLAERDRLKQENDELRDLLTKCLGYLRVTEHKGDYRKACELLGQRA